MYRYTSIWDLIKLLKANLFSSASIFVFVTSFISELNYYFLSLVTLDFIFCSLLISLSRLSIRIYFSHYKSYSGFKNKNLTNILIVGAGFSGQNIAKQILSGIKNDLNVIGFLDDDNFKIGKILHGVSVLGPISMLSESKLNFDEIMICIPSATSAEMQRIVTHCQNSGKRFKTLPSLLRIMEGKLSISQFRDVSFTDLLGREEILLDKTAIIDLLEEKEF